MQGSAAMVTEFDLLHRGEWFLGFRQPCSLPRRRGRIPREKTHAAPDEAHVSAVAFQFTLDGELGLPVSDDPVDLRLLLWRQRPYCGHAWCASCARTQQCEAKPSRATPCHGSLTRAGR